MDMLVSLFVANLFLAAYLALRYSPVGADIRVDLLVIWPFLAVISAWSLITLLRRRAP